MEIQNKKSKGFTLVEVMTVVVILLILAAFAVPEAIKAKPNFQLRSLAHDVLAVMQKARSLAVQHNTDVTVEFTGSGYSLIEDGGDATPLEVKYIDYGDARIGFDSDAKNWCGAAKKNWNGDEPPAVRTSMTFKPRGTTGDQGTIYFDNGLVDGNGLPLPEENRHCYAITVYTTGGVKLRKYNNGEWLE